MVHRRIGAAAAALALALVLLAPVVAEGANRRVAISDYRWSQPEIQIDLGEHVSWYWIGPDTMHSITGQSANATQLDSDPGDNQPIHEIGDTFRLDFDTPGVYQFNCKLHSTVKGQITVSGSPGDPVSEPDPIPRSRVDRTPPRLRDVRLGSATFGRRGTSLRFSLAEAAKLDAEIFRLAPDGGGRRFAGFQSWRGHVGFNGVRIGGRSDNFRPRPGSYVAELSATDSARNSADPKRLRFQIRSR